MVQCILRKLAASDTVILDTVLKGYLRYKTIFCNKVALDV